MFYMSMLCSFFSALCRQKKIPIWANKCYLILSYIFENMNFANKSLRLGKICS